jgi:hypothetical protein
MRNHESYHQSLSDVSSHAVDTHGILMARAAYFLRPNARRGYCSHRRYGRRDRREGDR